MNDTETRSLWEEFCSLSAVNGNKWVASIYRRSKTCYHCLSMKAFFSPFKYVHASLGKPQAHYIRCTAYDISRDVDRFKCQLGLAIIFMPKYLKMIYAQEEQHLKSIQITSFIYLNVTQMIVTSRLLLWWTGTLINVIPKN